MKLKLMNDSAFRDRFATCIWVNLLGLADFLTTLQHENSRELMFDEAFYLYHYSPKKKKLVRCGHGISSRPYLDQLQVTKYGKES
jgi:hypothetical protein